MNVEINDTTSNSYWNVELDTLPRRNEHIIIERGLFRVTNVVHCLDIRGSHSYRLDVVSPDKVLNPHDLF